MLMTKVRWLSICWMRKRPIKKPNGYRYCGQGWSMVSWPEIRTILPNAWRKILLVVFGLGVGSRAQAQMLNLNYQMSLPLGDQHDFISKMSFRGFSMDYHYFLSERLAVGASLGWNTLYKHLDYATGHFTMNGEKVTISGDQFRYLNVVPLMASVRYFFTDGDAVLLPYAGIGIGTNWAEMRLEVGDLLAKEKGWQFAFAPEVGVVVPFSESVGLNVGAQYRYSVKASGLPTLQDLGIKVGLSFNWL